MLNQSQDLFEGEWRIRISKTFNKKRFQTCRKKENEVSYLFLIEFKSDEVIIIILTNIFLTKQIRNFFDY